MANHPNRDFIAEAIADYEAMSQQERAKLLVSILEDQPFLMGLITNLSDDFSDSAHEALVESTVILINAFVSAGIPVDVVPQAILDEVVEEKVAAYEKRDENTGSSEALSDSPVVFTDLRNRALFHSDLDKAGAVTAHNFELVLNTIIAAVERSLAVEIEAKNKKRE